MHSSMGISKSQNSMQLKGIQSLLKRIGFMLLGIAVYRLGGFFPLPGVDVESCSEAFKRLQASSGSRFLLNLDKFFGGNLSKASIFSVGIQPYITASIFMRFLTIAFPRLKAMQREDSEGRARVHQYMRLLTVALAGVQAVTTVLLFTGRLNRMFGFGDDFGAQLVLPTQGYTIYLVMIPGLLAWSAFLMWLAEQLTEFGIGNGSSLFILAGQLSSLLYGLKGMHSALSQGTLSPFSALTYLAFSAILVYGVAFFERTYRKITIYFPERKMRYKHSGFAPTAYLPIKFNLADMMPIIASNGAIGTLRTLAGFGLNQYPNSKIFKVLSWFMDPDYLGHTFCLALMLGFSVYVYTSVNFDGWEIADQLKRDHAFFEGIRPGQKTAIFLEKIAFQMMRLAWAYLVVLVCLVPSLCHWVWGKDYVLSGVTLLLTVSIIMDILENVVAHLYSHRYESVLRRSSFWQLKKKARAVTV